MSQDKEQAFLLKIELVPKTCFYSNVRKVVSKSKWDKIRKKAYKRSNNKCAICDTKNVKLNCHEIWSYDDQKHIQHLDGFQALCENCHMIKHAGFSMHTKKGKELYDREKLIRHFCEVNECTKEDFLEHEKAAFKKWRERSQHEWKQPWIKRFKENKRNKKLDDFF